MSTSSLTEKYPGMEEELRDRHYALDMQLDRIVKKKNYEIVGKWEGHTVYSIPVDDLLGVRSAAFCRRKGAYRPIVTEMVEGSFVQRAPLPCFVAGDLMLRVKWGNIIYWAAKETRKMSHLNCVFAGDVEKTEFLKSKLLETYEWPASVFL